MITPEERARHTRETRLRAVAKRRGFKLTRSRRRDCFALDFERYALVSLTNGQSITPMVGGMIHNMSLDQVEQYLNRNG